jgi:hypothetical protein
MKVIKNIKKNREPRTDPCDTPRKTSKDGKKGLKCIQKIAEW